MKRVVAIGAMLVGGLIAFQALSPVRRRRLGAAVRSQMLNRMERMMASLPDGSPPKLIMSVLPQLRDQNNLILRMLQEQNDWLREQRHTSGPLRHDTSPTPPPRA